MLVNDINVILWCNMYVSWNYDWRVYGKGVKKMEVENPMVLGKEEEPYPIGYDVFENEIYTGDEILVFDDDVYLKDELSSDAVEILKRLGCEERVAGKD